MSGPSPRTLPWGAGKRKKGDAALFRLIHVGVQRFMVAVLLKQRQARDRPVSSVVDQTARSGTSMARRASSETEPRTGHAPDSYDPLSRTPARRTVVPQLSLGTRGHEGKGVRKLLLSQDAPALYVMESVTRLPFSQHARHRPTLSGGVAAG